MASLLFIDNVNQVFSGCGTQFVVGKQCPGMSSPARSSPARSQL